MLPNMVNLAARRVDFTPKSLWIVIFDYFSNEIGESAQRPGGDKYWSTVSYAAAVSAALPGSIRVVCSGMLEGMEVGNIGQSEV